MSVMPTVTGRKLSPIGTVTIIMAIAVLATVVVYQLWGVLQDTALLLDYRFGADYGEGIVWQQVLLMFGPRMYSPSPELPFIVFHYPPLYHIVVRGLLTLRLDPLFAGRLVSALSAAVCATCIGALIVVSVPGPRSGLKVGLAVVVSLMFLCLPAIRIWGALMRVDMLAEALGLLGTLVLVLSRCSMRGVIAALLLCVASLFAKQTQLPAGIAVFVVALACVPRVAIVAALVSGGVGLALVAVLEVATGGFLKNIISYNINPFILTNAAANVWKERESGPFLLFMLFGVAAVAWRFKRDELWAKLRGHDRQTIALLVITLHFILACGSGLEILKDGAGNNYFIDLLASGCVLIGVLLCACLIQPALVSAIAVILALSLANLRHHYVSREWFARDALQSEQLVTQIAAADRPVASDDMVLVMRAGKSLVFEPAIVRVLVAGGKWDPAELLAMIRNHGFAFALTFTSGSESGPLVTRAIEDAYPRQEEFRRGLITHLAQ